MKLNPVIIFALSLLFTLGNAIAAKGHIEGHMPDSVAEMEYRIFLEFKPNHYEIRIKLATVLMNQDKLAAAESEFNLALVASPKNPEAHIGLSKLRLKQHRITDALEFMQKALEIDPENPSVYLIYGQALEADQQPRKAGLMYKDGLTKLSQNPEDPEALHNRAILEEALRKVEGKRTENE